MDSSIFIKRRRNPKECANTLSLITFFYVNKIWRIGEEGDITEDHLFYVHKKLRAKPLGDKLEYIARKLLETRKYLSTMSMLILFCGRKYFYLSITQLIMMAIFVIASPFLLGKFVLFFSPDQTEVNWKGACFFGVSYITLSIVQYVYEQNYEMIKEEIRIEFQTALCSLIYRKSLRLSPKALSEITIGKIVSLISKDINVFGYIIRFGSDWFVGVIQIVITMYLFYLKTGAATFAGFAILLTTLPIQVYIAKVIKNKRTKSNEKSDERLQLTQEILASIRIIKMYTWEKFFSKRITDARRNEMKKLRQVLIYKDVSFLLGKFCSVLSFYILISSYVWMGHTLSAELVFYLYTSYDNLEDTIIGVIPVSISQVGETIASLKRYDAFFNAEETTNCTLITLDQKLPRLPQVSFCDVVVKLQKMVVLNNITVDMKPGLNIIVGNVGSGKSLLLKTILREYEISSGKLCVTGRVSYAGQYPWLFPSTIKQNILFGEKYDEEKYRMVLDICALEFDLKLLQLGDRTVIGDCGINLSKGQQARVNLARAIYRKSDIYLLDDCLSSLDPNVRRHIFTSLKTYLIGKICILVTHQNRFLEDADNVIIMNAGTVIYSGNCGNIPSIFSKRRKRVNSSSRNSMYGYICNGEVTEDETSKLLEDEDQRINIYLEDKNAGKVPIDVYKKYILFGGGYLFYGVIVILLISAGSLMTYGKEILSQWVDMDEHRNILSKKHNRSSTEFDILTHQSASAFNIYTIITIIGSAFWLLSLMLHFYFASKISMSLHKAMIESVLGSTMEFFDKNLIGNILNRFSKDIYYIDEELVYSTNDFIMVFVIVVSTATLISSINGVFFVSSIVFEIIFVLLGYYLLPIGRNLRRLNSSTRSPIVGHLNASLEGIATVRAWQNSDILKDEFDYHQDLYTSAHHTMITFATGFSLVLKMISSIFMAIIVGNFLFLKPDAAGKVGLSLTQVSLLTYCLESCLRQWVELESQMTCFERALEYTDIHQEPVGGIVIDKWPSTPSIEFKNVFLSYGLDGKQVLKNLNFRIESKERAAIVGRTGAGKSSIIVALFRMYDIEGNILIDSVDTKTLPLEKLRENLTIIPQDPILFTASMRSNLDPYQRYTDAEIWNAVREVNLDKHITNLEQIVTDCGAHLSIGQRQLICIARALLDRHKIIVLDEATANMDEEMETFIHETIDKHFSECTVISISHRLRQVIHYDKLLVMEEGELVEYGRPKELLENPNGVFYRMAHKAHLV
ncbi:hypothetical protein HHI36_001136 [Cryptolaemus montrouzieri]|uniref:Uncharacterized protein n=1 Tax=Cryptolaemus montrouzieri TaxID=559131 RepID=A0ABD2P7F6_9CUCU